MPYQLWTQDNFTKGELSPYMYSRVGNESYFNGLKQAQNVLTYPTGAAGKRFGTVFNSVLNDSITSYNQIFFEIFQYLDICIYQLVYRPLAVDIYLEGVLVKTVTTTLNQQEVFNLNSTVLGNTFRVTGAGFKPYDLTVALDGGSAITGVSGNEFTAAGGSFVDNVPIPVQFVNSGGALPTTSPQLTLGVTYFINASSDTNTAVYTTANDAKYNLNAIVITDAGTGTNTLYQLNTWSIAHTILSDLPFYDFNAKNVSYDALTFTPSATTGSSITITVSGSGYSLLDSSYVGGAFIGAGGTSRIISVASHTSFTVSVQTPFDSTDAIQGSLALLAEPAWSDTRGWPQKCSSYQNRAIFANTVNLPNGFWASVINDYANFGNLTTDDDDAISWFPTSNNVNVIRFIVPFRSITVHTNTGIYSSPLSEIAAITPTTFTLQLQDSTPADILLPQAIDNQIIVISGNDAHTMLWDGINNAYTSNIISAVNEQTIRNPVDEIAYADLTHAGSRYVFIVNASGSMAVFQTLFAEQVSGFTPQITEQPFGLSYFLQVGSSTDGRAWFICQRNQANAQSPIAISDFTSGAYSTLKATGSDFSQTDVTAVTFTNSGSFPTTVPALEANTFYWVFGIDADNFAVYLNIDDAVADVNRLEFTDAGSSANVVPWQLDDIFTLEELSWDIFLDCAVYFNVSPATSSLGSADGMALFNAQQVTAVGDGFAFTEIVSDSTFNFEAHGSPVEVSEGYVGYPINTIIEPMPIASPPGQQTTLTKPIHVRTIRFVFNNTIGGTINGVPIALNKFDMADIGDPPQLARGIFEISTMNGWDNFNVPAFTLVHSDPFNMQLLGIQYSVDT